MESRKNADTQYKDARAIKRYFKVFSDTGKKYLDEVTPLDVMLLIRLLDKRGKAESTIKNTVAMIKKVYNCLIDEIEDLSMRNPVPKRVAIPRKQAPPSAWKRALEYLDILCDLKIHK